MKPRTASRLRRNPEVSSAPSHAVRCASGAFLMTRERNAGGAAWRAERRPRASPARWRRARFWFLAPLLWEARLGYREDFGAKSWSVLDLGERVDGKAS